MAAMAANLRLGGFPWILEKACSPCAVLRELRPASVTWPMMELIFFCLLF
jgi:hypothetical protein